MGPLIVAKEKQFVFYDREPNRAPELIAFKNSLALVKEVACIQFLVSQELVSGTVNSVCPRFGHDVDNGARETTIFRVEGICKQPKFLNRVEGGHDGSTVINALLNVTAI